MTPVASHRLGQHPETVAVVVIGARRKAHREATEGLPDTSVSYGGRGPIPSLFMSSTRTTGEGGNEHRGQPLRLRPPRQASGRVRRKKTMAHNELPRTSKHVRASLSPRFSQSTTTRASDTTVAKFAHIGSASALSSLLLQSDKRDTISLATHCKWFSQNSKALPNKTEPPNLSWRPVGIIRSIDKWS